ncbi:F-box family protein [Rhynchospora pubera]|uniref:F-box family protein n=1 Tax=Rhynchospora pubera TaxID=906938 RepID=A0AAV8DJP4_9POAL|nr:F-box family protein [Rhynchospora pubera]
MVETEIKMRSTSTSELPDLSHLPGLAVHLISTKVKSIVDYVRFRAVCSSWRSASPPKPCHLPPQLPWLMIIEEKTMKEGMGLFYDLWESKMRKIHLPEIAHMWCLASCRGWLLLAATGGQEVLLLNPLTQARIQLPPFNTEFKYLDDDTRNPFYDCLRLSVNKVTFSTDLTDPNCLIIVFHQGMRMIQICRVGEPCWTDVTGGPSYRFQKIHDATYYNGRLYLLYRKTMVNIDLNKPEESIVSYYEPEIKNFRKHFLEGKSEVYVVVAHPSIEEDEVDSAARNIKYGTKETRKPKMELYQFQEQSLKLNQISDTNNTAMFCGWGDFFLAVCCDEWDLVDCVGGKYIDVRGSWVQSNCHICSTKLGSGKSEVLCYLDAGLFIESLIWFQPSFG